MSAARRRDSHNGVNSLLFSPLPAAPPAGGIRNPPRKKQARKRLSFAGQQEFYPPDLDRELARYVEQMEKTYRDPFVPEHQRSAIRRTFTLREFYETWLLPEHRQRQAAGELSRATLKKYRQALTRWEEHSRPDEWPSGKPWQGVPIGSITGLYLESVLLRMRARLSPDSVRSTWNHLRTILNFADQVRALEKAPQRKRQKAMRREPRTYTTAELDTAYRALDGYADLQVAFVLACNCGMRAVDLFLLRWENFDLDGERPTVSFRARKTGKDQRLPLAPVTVAQLQRLTSFGRSGLLFPGRTNPEAQDPEKSRAAERRRETVRTLFSSAGLEIAKPFQVARATCNTRLNSTRGFDRSGNFMLGHDLGCNSTSYMNPSELMFQAVRAVEQPACFLVF